MNDPTAPEQPAPSAPTWPRCAVGEAVIDMLGPDEAVDVVLSLARSSAPRRHVVVTPNSQHLALLRSSPALRAVYSRAALVLPDGAPVAWAAQFISGHRQRRVTGADLLPALCAGAAKQRLTVGFLGGRPGAAERAAARLCAEHPGLGVVHVSAPAVGFEHDAAAVSGLLEEVRRGSPQLLFVGLGTPKQEVFADSHGEELGPGVVLCIGAAIDFASGAVRRAPALLQRLGMEWTWRLALEPLRLGPRYAIAAIHFLRVVAPHVVRAVLRRTARRT